MVQINQNRLSISIKEITAWLYALYGVRAVWLAFNSTQYSPVFYMLNQLIGYLCIPAGLLLLVREQKNAVDKNNFILMLLPLTYWLMCVIHTYGGWKLGNGVVTLIQISIFLFLDKDVRISVFDKFYKFIQGCNLISIFIWLFDQVELPIFQSVPFYVGSWATYKKWFVFAIYHQKNYLSNSADRLCGIFNEPGALGTICALLFIATFKNTKKWEKALLLVTGMLTYSAAFFVLIFGYLIVYLLQKDIRYAAVAIAIGIFFLQLPNIDFGNPTINSLAARLEITSDGFAGDNRVSDAYEVGYEAMKETRDIYFGYGKGFSFSNGTSSYITYIVQFGYIGFGLMILQWLAASLWNAKNKEQLIYILFFAISLYQRPAPITSILGYILIFGGLAWMQQKQEEKDELAASENIQRIV